MSVHDAVHWLIDHTTKDGAVSPEKTAELHATVDENGSPALVPSKKGKADGPTE